MGSLVPDPNFSQFNVSDLQKAKSYVLLQAGMIDKYGDPPPRGKIAHPAMSLDEIAEVLGYSSKSSLITARNRWEKSGLLNAVQGIVSSEILLNAENAKIRVVQALPAIVDNLVYIATQKQGQAAIQAAEFLWDNFGAQTEASVQNRVQTVSPEMEYLQRVESNLLLLDPMNIQPPSIQDQSESETDL